MLSASSRTKPKKSRRFPDFQTSIRQEMNIYDRAEQMVAKSPRPMTISEALSQLGKRGARVRQAKRPKKMQPAPPAWWNDPDR